MLWIASGAESLDETGVKTDVFGRVFEERVVEKGKMDRGKTSLTT
jgi:hypothetical protein